MTAPSELAAPLPCPFCGSSKVDPEGWTSLEKIEGTEKWRSGPACDDCGASADTVEAWNTRSRIPSAPDVAAPPSAIKEALELCVEEMRESIENEGRRASFKSAITKAEAALASLDAPAKEAAAPAAGGDAEPVAWRYRAVNVSGELQPGWRFSEEPSALGLYEPLYTTPPLQAPAHSDAVREALVGLLVENDSEDADDDCELCEGRGTVDAYTARDGDRQGRDEIGCPACIERVHSRITRAALSASEAKAGVTVIPVLVPDANSTSGQRIEYRPAPTPAVDREAVAQIVDPHAFKNWGDLYRVSLNEGDTDEEAKRCSDRCYGPDCDRALAKADAIISLLAPTAPAQEGE